MSDNFSKTNDEKMLKETDEIRYISILESLKLYIYTITQTQDLFLLRFQPEYSECDISIYEFKNYFHIREEVLERLKTYKFPLAWIHLFFMNLDIQSSQIDSNIEYFGVPHFWSIKE